MSELILELFSEEIPARMLSVFTSSLAKSIIKKLGQQPELTCLYTPRRVCIHLGNLTPISSDITEEIKGPRVEAPNAALEGFMRKYDISDKSKMEIRNGCYFYSISHKQKDIKLIIKEAIELSLKEAVWPKSMKWGSYDIKWVRPLHLILCIFDNEVIPVEFGHLRGNNKTYGHRFLSNREISITSADLQNYEKKLEENFVILDPKKRKELIEQGINEVIAGKNLNLIEDGQLMNEVVNLVEYPVVYLGEIDAKFMVLPEEVLITTLRNNQRYLMLRNNTTNKLAPYFVIVANTKTQDQGKEVIEGNQKVLNARLYDALFFFENDKKIRLEQRVAYLKQLTFHKEIGSVYDKMQSVKSLAEKLAVMLGFETEIIKRAVELTKADLVSEMVGEFPELQGIMGYYYALNDRESNDIAITIKDHYKPLGPNDYVPTNKVTAVVALADKLDTLNQMFAINIKPTGSKDPFALRRAANGVVRIIAENKFPLDLEKSLKELGIRSDVISYILEREVASSS